MVVRLARAARRLLTRSAPALATGPVSEHDAAARHASLFEGLNHLLTLADRLPFGGSGNDVRRSVCEMIEAKSGVERRDTRRRLLRLIDAVKQRNARGRSREGDAGATEVEQLIDALHHRDLK
jgi:hypothetical protein